MFTIIKPYYLEKLKTLSGLDQRIVSVQCLEYNVYILTADLNYYYISKDWFTPNSQGLEPDYNNINICEYGLYIKFGDYEVSSRTIIREGKKNDKDMIC